MGKIKVELQKISIRKSMTLTFFIAISVICILSGITIFSANNAQQEILRNRYLSIQVSDIQRDEITESYSLDLEQNNVEWHPLSNQQNVIYYSCYAAMIGLPVLYIIAGIGTASAIYYRLKLRKPISELQKGIVSIQNNDLDFEIIYNSNDELGELCASMEKMRRELRHNTKTLWELLDQRKLLNSSIAHDLRTPLTVLRGYLDYLGKNITQDKLTEEMIMDTVCSMQGAVNRLERYVDCVHDIEKMDNIEIHCVPEDTSALLYEMESNISQLTNDKEIIFTHHVSRPKVNIDKHLLFRIVENLLQNAIRYANKKIIIDISDKDDFLTIMVKDDGKGFSENDLVQATVLFYGKEKGNEHFGIGLNICRILCEKQGGFLRLANNDDGGALVIAKLNIN